MVDANVSDQAKTKDNRIKRNNTAQHKKKYTKQNPFLKTHCDFCNTTQ